MEAKDAGRIMGSVCTESLLCGERMVTMTDGDAGDGDDDDDDDAAAAGDVM